MACSVHVPAPYKIVEVDGLTNARLLHDLNKQFKDAFLPLKHHHLEGGMWWVVYDDFQAPVGFGGMVRFEPFDEYWYIKRTAILKAHRGHGLQLALIRVCEAGAKKFSTAHTLVSSCEYDNPASANSFINAGFKLCKPERPWEPKSLFWIKKLGR